MCVFAGTLAAFGIFFKPVLLEFGWTRALVSGAFSLSWIMQGALAIVMGRLTDRLGPRIVISLCGIQVGVGYLLMSRITSLEEFYLSFGLVGIGMSGANVSLVSTVARWFVKRRGLMTGVVLAGGGMGALITPAVANWLIRVYGWRHSYIIMGCLVLLVIIAGAQFLRKAPTDSSIPPRGYQAHSKPQFDSKSKRLAKREPIRTRQLWMVFAMFFSLGFSAYVVMVHIAPHATDVGSSPNQAAEILACVGGFAIAGRVLLGIIGDRIGNRQTFILSYALMAASILCLIFATDTRLLYFSAGLLGFAWGVGALGSPLVAEIFGLGSLGANVGVINLGYSLGAALGPLIAGYLFDMSHSYRLAFVLTLSVVVFALFLSLLLKPRLSAVRQPDEVLKCL